MKKILFMLCSVLAAPAFAQTPDIPTVPDVPPADTSFWKKGGVMSVNVSQSSFTNWAASPTAKHWYRTGRTTWTWVTAFSA